MDKVKFTGMGFPSSILQPRFTVLSLFSAAFGGEQDVQFIHKAGVVDCELIDIDYNKVSALGEKYGYKYSSIDAFILIEVETFQRNIIVSDHWTNQDAKIHGKYFDKLKSLATDYLILGISQAYIDTLDAIPEGDYYYRSDFQGGVYWRVIEC